jgi:hypothetical protein
VQYPLEDVSDSRIEWQQSQAIVAFNQDYANFGRTTIVYRVSILNIGAAASLHEFWIGPLGTTNASNAALVYENTLAAGGRTVLTGDPLWVIFPDEALFVQSDGLGNMSYLWQGFVYGSLFG